MVLAINEYLEFKEFVENELKSSAGLKELEILKQDALKRKDSLKYYLICKSLKDLDYSSIDNELFNKGKFDEALILKQLGEIKDKNVLLTIKNYKDFFNGLNNLNPNSLNNHIVVQKYNLLQAHFPVLAKNYEKYLHMPNGYFYFNKAWQGLIKKLKDEFEELKK